MSSFHVLRTEERQGPRIAFNDAVGASYFELVLAPIAPIDPPHAQAYGFARFSQENEAVECALQARSSGTFELESAGPTALDTELELDRAPCLTPSGAPVHSPHGARSTHVYCQ